MSPFSSRQPSELHPASLIAQSARYPLTVFDNLFERSTFLTGWLVQGKIDTDALAAALGRMTEKWRVLAGRLEAIPDVSLDSRILFSDLSDCG